VGSKEVLANYKEFLVFLYREKEGLDLILSIWTVFGAI